MEQNEMYPFYRRCTNGCENIGILDTSAFVNEAQQARAISKNKVILFIGLIARNAYFSRSQGRHPHSPSLWGNIVSYVV